MASTKKSSKEEEETKKTKKKTNKETPTKPKTPTKPTQLDSPKNKNKNKTPNGKLPKTTTQGHHSKPKKRNREEKDNEVGEDGLFCRFPMARIKRIMKSEDPDLAFGSDVVFLLNKATQMFLEKFAEDGYKCSVRDRKKSLNYNRLASVVSKERRYDFLSDYVPEKVRAEEALSRRKLVENGQE